MAVEDSNTKFCSKCGETKSINEFSKHSGNHDGLQCHCKACHRIALAAWHAANPEKRMEHRAANLEKYRESAVKWRDANIEKARATTAKWAAENLEAIRIHCQNYRARKRANGGKLSPGLAAKLLKLQRGKCACCHVSIADGNHMDHVIPVALGGPNEDWNMQLLCPPCNHQKSKKHPVDFMQSRGFLC